MQVGAAPAKKPGLRPLRWLVGATFMVLAVLLLVILAHAATSVASLVSLAEALASALLVLSVATVLTGIVFAWRSYPEHRRVVAFVVALTLATLVAHAFILGVPAATTQGSVTGAPGKTFGDSRVQVYPTQSGRVLQVSVTANGSDAIAGLSLQADGVPLPPGDFGAPVNYTSPLLPGSSVSGIWVLATNQTVSSLTVGYQDLSCYTTDAQVFGCIMDEVYYVPSAQHLLAGSQCVVSAPRNTGAYCNPEHPFLSKALMAAGMAVLGPYDSAGWRLFPALLGSFGIPLLFGIAWKLSGSKKLAVLSAVLLSIDILYFSLSSAAVLDVPAVFFGLAAFFAYFADLRWWRLDRYVISGILLGAAGLSKETAVFTVGALVTYIFLFEEGNRIVRLLSSVKVLLVVGAVFIGGLQAFDSTLAAGAFPTFVQHVSYMLSYGSSLIADKLACQPTTGYWCLYPNNPGGAPILPTDWLTYYSPTGYFVVTVSSAAAKYVSIGYYGVTNLLETWSTFIWAPLVAYTLFRWYRSRGEGSPALDAPVSSPIRAPLSGDLRLATFALVFFLWEYVPYIFLMGAGRVTYPFYFVAAVPAVALGAAYWISRSWFPRSLMYVYLGAAFFFFLVYFPDKGFLPVWVRVLLGH